MLKVPLQLSAPDYLHRRVEWQTTFRIISVFCATYAGILSPEYHAGSRSCGLSVGALVSALSRGQFNA